MNINNLNNNTVNTTRRSVANQHDEVSMDNFLQLMIAQLRNQDFNNPVDDTQFIAQLAQFSTLRSMQELTQFTKTSFASSLIGKEVSANRIDADGRVSVVQGTVTRVSMQNNEFHVFVNEVKHTLEQIIEIRKGK